MLSLGLLRFSLGVQALEGDVVRPYVNATYSYDDNLRRMYDKGSDSSDRMWMVGAGIILDKSISRQKVFVDIGVNETKFDRNSDFNNTGKDLNARWDWVVGNRWKGKIDLGHKEAMVPFAEFRGTTLNLRTNDRRVFDAIYSFHPRWRARVGIGRYETKYDGLGQSIGNLIETAQEFQVDYVTPHRGHIGLVYRHVNGDRPVLQNIAGMLVDNSYEQNEYKLNTEWQVTGKTGLQFLGGLVQRTHKEFTQRDFSGFNARMNINHLLTGKTKLNMSAWREINAQSFVTSTFTLNKGIKLGSDTMLSGKTSLRGSVQYQRIEFDGDVLFESYREDTLKTASLGLVYQAMPALSLNGSLNYTKRDSSRQFTGFNSTSIALTAQYEF